MFRESAAINTAPLRGLSRWAPLLAVRGQSNSALFSARQTSFWPDCCTFSDRIWRLSRPLCRGPFSEVALILMVFAAAGAWPVPDVNETAYLTKARHQANPAWGSGDFFLESPEAHGVFYRLLGPLAATLPLDDAAWIGRWLGWLALAVGFRHAAAPLLIGLWPRVLAAAFFSLALRHTTAAGEWVIGGCEAKVFAWALVLVAAGEIALGRCARAWLALGGATALHPIVGGWGMVAMVLLSLWERISQIVWKTQPLPDSDAAIVPSGRGPGMLAAACLLGGVLLAAAGIVPALGLSAGADTAMRAAAARIHVVERLSHHLLLRTFADGMVARHVLAILVWWLLGRMLPGDSPRITAARARATGFTVAAMVVSLAGCGISLLEPVAPRIAYSLLRFYWFRLADGLVPLSLAMAAAAVVCNAAAVQRLLPVRPIITRSIIVALLLLDLVHESRHWPLPGRPGLAARGDSKVDAAAWRETCDWVAANTPLDACFLTPRGAASFTWRTGRREVVGWKNSPQDARSLVEWRQRMVDCFSRDGTFTNMERSTAALGPDRLRLVAERYAAEYAIIPLDAPGIGAIPFERLHADRGYAVYRLAP